MDAYSRCSDHGLVRCAKCNPQPRLTLQPAPAAPVFTQGSPEDLLDGPVAVAAPLPSPTPVTMDSQTVEALERQKEILASRDSATPAAPAEVNFGLSESPEPPVQNEIFAGPSVKSPIVEIACCIHKSQKDYDAAVERVKRAEKELSDAQADVAPAAERHARAKETLRELLQ